MHEMSLEKSMDLLSKLTRLNALSEERASASKAGDEANRRWNSARKEYAALHAEIVLEYGDENAPVWVESLYGPQLVAK